MDAEIHEVSKRVRFSSSYETQLLIKRLQELADSKDTEVIVTYKELSSICGRNVQGSGRGLLATARKKVEEGSNCLFDPVTNVGIRLMKPKEQVGIGQRALTQIRNKSKRTLVRMGRVEYSELSADDKRLHNAQASALGATAMFSSTAALKEIESKVVDRPLQIGQTLDMFPKA